MQNRRSFAILIFLIVLSSIAYANTPLPGYYIDKNGDSLLCKIEYGDWVRNPKSIQVEVNNEKRILGVAEIRRFGVFGYGDYEAAKVSYHVSPFSGTDLPEEYSDSVAETEVFLKIRVKGKYNLYELILPERPYYFIGKGDSAISELIYRARRRDNEIQDDARYKQALSVVFAQEGKLERYRARIDVARYNSDILSLIEILDGIQRNSNNQKGGAERLEWGIYLEGLMHFFPTSFNAQYSTPDKLNTAYSPTGGIYFIYAPPHHFKAFRVGLSIGYDRYSTSITKSGSNSHYESAAYNYVTRYTENLSLTNSMILTNVFALYIINPHAKANLCLKAGVGYNVSLRSNPAVYDDYNSHTTGIRNGVTPISDSTQGNQAVMAVSDYFNFSGAVGLVCGRHKVEFAYFIPAKISSGIINHPFSQEVRPFKMGMVGLYYYYSIFR